MVRKERFSFEFKGLPADTFSVVGFTATEGLSQLYEYRIELVSRRDDLEIDHAQGGLAVFTFRRDDGDMPVHGALSRFEQVRAVDRHVFYRAVLSPRLWRLTLTSHNQIFLDKSAPEFLSDALKDARILHASDFEFRLTGRYPKREYVCQYNESHYQFVARWLEREGMYYFFEHGEQGDKLIIADSAAAHPRGENPPRLRYTQSKGLDKDDRKDLCTAFVREQNPLPATVKVRDYNYRMPALDLQAESEIDNAGVGDLYVYGDNVKDTDEARRQTTLRAEEARCRKTRHKGRSTGVFLRAGAAFRMENHFRQDANTDYLPVYIKHEGSQTGYLMAGLGRCLADREARDFYGNTFAAIPADLQYRPPRKTPWPKFYGVMNAVIDAEGSGQYAELDEHGRYKVRLPFDLANRPAGKASSWIRMAEPYGGSGYGMHFPLHKGTGVLLTFVDGDLDRPVIASAAPNFEQQSIVKDANAPANAIRSASGNQLVLGDQKGQEFIGLFSPFHRSGIAVGSHEPGGGGSIAMSTEGNFDTLTLGATNSTTVGASNSLVAGGANFNYVGMRSSIVAGTGFDADLGPRVSYTKGPRIHLGEDTYDVVDNVSFTGTKSLSLSGGASASLSQLKKKAHAAMWGGLGASLAAGAGAAAMAQCFGPQFLQDNVMNYSSPWFAAGAVGEVLGVAGSVAASVATWQVVDKINDITTQKTATLTLDDQGAEINVDATLKAASFKAEVNKGALSAPDQKSFIEIGEGGKFISIVNKNSAYLTIEKGNKILMECGKSSVEITDTIEAESDEILLKSNKDLKLKFNNFNAGGQLRVAHDGRVEIA